jgi:hypothetical protein
VGGQGRLEKQRQPCQVRFEVIRPINLRETPYILWVSTGEHNHPPPPIYRLPTAIRNDIIALFTRINDPNLTLSRYRPSSEPVCEWSLIGFTDRALVNQEVANWLRQHQVSTFGELHPALNNHDRIGLCILYSKLQTFPNGHGIGGVQYEYWSKHHDNPKRVRNQSEITLKIADNRNQYIQDVVFDGQNFAVFCFYREQAELLAQQESFEIDMAFKRVRDQGVNEIVIAKFFHQHRRGIIRSQLRNGV